MLKQAVIDLYNNPPQAYLPEHRQLFAEFISKLNSGSIRACEKQDDLWQVNAWIKMGILIGFRMGVLAALPDGNKDFFDKDTLAAKRFSLTDQVRIVPGGTSARNGCYVAKGVTVMPPAFINIGAWVDSGTMVDSHALVGSCAQIGKRVHLSAGAMIGGVLEPIGSRPVIIEDDAFIGGNTGIYEGIIVKSRAVIASGTIITGSTPIYDSIAGRFLDPDAGGSYTIPADAVVVPGSRRLRSNQDFQVYCPIIVKYRDAKTDVSVALENELRHLMD
ncbi:MAG: 2,3,4,5-tetrahydropyridine-2,6-dicarboxylate N-succinyltransferase [Candidatus Cloacimonetes bacterium]|nr:2,3,4,5-tetrahydropyridine-2,6-dicarboxylate N-succinyltransferase [Candidatus Cloacimonadota bacterium]HOA28638.1 2,3,4,5-tetrahydropyridine-2,6-dicarboxylate N-succinyltransferase [Candidatus Cloacimonadota bacterium]HOH59541.1 2,3,4,5-tetrahydropyridine-2,6-dicarboxylate N-succinyltransferase [Candidatus Cloacimonadota bacterium]HPI26792.1 2,3,4,5-tetrahydropyridine-2,6-dicarboxylate N-succinyltransferase [Candidatus Cloacimonadota bacterium]